MGELHAVAGTIGEVHEGESVTVYGTFGEHKTYGFQFQAQSCETAVPQGPDRSAGVSVQRGTALYRRGHGAQDYRPVWHADPGYNCLRSGTAYLYPGITSEKARAIQHEFQRMFGVREAITWLGRFGISPSRAVEVFRHLGPATVDALTLNPYLLCGRTAADAFYPGG